MISNNNENSYSKTYKKKQFKNWKILIFNFCQHFLKTTDWPISTTRERKQFSGQKIIFKIFRVLNLENFSKISQNRGQNLEILLQYL